MQINKIHKDKSYRPTDIVQPYTQTEVCVPTYYMKTETQPTCN